MYKIYVDQYGVITHYRESSVDPEPGVGLIVNRPVDINKEYYLNGTIRVRPIMPSVLIGSIVSSIPSNAHAIIDGVHYDLIDSELELEFDTPGIHKIYLYAPPYQDKEFTIET